MFDQNIQNALAKLDVNAKKRKRKRSLIVSLAGLALIFSVFGGVWGYQQMMPSVSMDHLSRLIIVASRSSDNDPIRLLGDIERRMGKKMENLSNTERVDAVAYLMNHIELHHNRQELISY
ncbi:MAG: hypothetical protein ACNI26_02130 [Terasakiella sp.]|uniref:hypothetical protein n=1 Tax=unclassified Terasakiella TaxID=2614952 RepID=UPI003B00D1BE